MQRIRRRREPQGPLAALREIDWEERLRDTSGDTSSLSFASGLVLGFIVGVIVALLLAPERGERVAVGG